uniref:Uncharacterized protein n=1 Tax=Meloidogyne enterolobii TaxID=390850 RepID=A0A6V7VNQ1_MELEN|nr:unnamed protein product [Meloidogyne enterolobii]
MYFLIWGNKVVNEDFIVINVPKQTLEENEFNEYKNTLPENIRRNLKFCENDFYKFVGIYKAAIEDVPVCINPDSTPLDIIEWLQDTKFDLGISEFSEMGGAFTLFYQLNINKIINISSTPLDISFLQFFGFNLDEEMPAYNNVMPGDGYLIKQNPSNNSLQNYYLKNKEYNQLNNRIVNCEYNLLFKYYYDAVMFNLKKKGYQIFGLKNIPKLSLLLENFNYFLINQHPLAIYSELPENENKQKFVYIGGLELTGINKEKKKNKMFNLFEKVGDLEILL